MAKAPRRIRWRSSITQVKRNRLITHGYDQTQIISEFSYEEMVFLLLFGRRATAVEAELLRAVIVSHISHGITGQSTLAVMQAADCRADFINAAIAGFSVGSGPFHQGGLRIAMEQLSQYAAHPPARLARRITKQVHAGERIFGFGHRFHDSDPRALALLQLAREHHFDGPHLKAARAIERTLFRLKGLRMNIEAAGGAILLDLGVPASVAHMIILVGRAPMYAAVYLERLSQAPKPFQRIEVCDIVPGSRGKRTRAT